MLKLARKFFRFRLRTLLIVMAIVAIIMSYLASNLSIVRARQQARVEAEREGTMFVPEFSFTGKPSKPISSLLASWVSPRAWLGDQPVYLIVINSNIESKTHRKQELSEIFPEASFYETGRIYRSPSTQPSRSGK